MRLDSFLIFSTARSCPFATNRGQARTSPASQLRMTTVMGEADGSITSRPAIDLCNRRNLTEGIGENASIATLVTNIVAPASDPFKGGAFLLLIGGMPVDPSGYIC